MLLRKRKNVMRKRKPKVPAGLSTNYAQLYQAFRTVGQEAETQLRWLTEFAARDLSDPIVAELARWEADAFVQTWAVRWNIEPFRSLLQHPPEPAGIISEGMFRGPIAPQFRAGPSDPPDFDGVEVLALQREAKRLLEDLWQEHSYGHDVRLRGYALPDGVFTHLSIKGLNRRAHITTEKDPRSRFIGAMVSLLLAAGPLRFCRDCNRMFVSRRPWQQSCSARCTNRLSQEAHRKRRAAQVVKSPTPARAKRRRKTNG